MVRENMLASFLISEEKAFGLSRSFTSIFIKHNGLSFPFITISLADMIRIMQAS